MVVVAEEEEEEEEEPHCLQEAEKEREVWHLQSPAPLPAPADPCLATGAPAHLESVPRIC